MSAIVKYAHHATPVYLFWGQSIRTFLGMSGPQQLAMLQKKVPSALLILSLQLRLHPHMWSLTSWGRRLRLRCFSGPDALRKRNSAVMLIFSTDVSATAAVLFLLCLSGFYRPSLAITRPSDKGVYEGKVTELTPTESENAFWLREVGFTRGIWSESCEQDPREASGPSEMRKIVVGDVTTMKVGFSFSSCRPR